ncbi:CAAX amino protease [Vallitalea longa]|uniref:CAAX amino protease n=1 Tax=Vallitalea longa TaxID=2936439 RepID=A0A9W5YFA9_9FIRM|nr:CPBP family intramembrane glutamic endopeptidase [Vallitalea longa]GKX32009.1 CAAX amino protease [Vallitalea longa]
MNIHIHYHSILVLLATVYPVSFPQIILSFRGRYNHKNQNMIYLEYCVIMSSIILILSCVLVPISNNIIISSDIMWYIISIVAAPILIIIEFIIGTIILRLSGKMVKGISVNANWKKISIVGCISTILLAIIEELIYRQLWSVAMLDNLHWNIYLYIILSSVIYGFNHLYYGFATFIQKTISGILLAVIFLLSGRSIIIPIIIHVLQNLIILLMGRYKK